MSTCCTVQYVTPLLIINLKILPSFMAYRVYCLDYAANNLSKLCRAIPKYHSVYKEYE